MNIIIRRRNVHIIRMIDYMIIKTPTITKSKTNRIQIYMFRKKRRTKRRKRRKEDSHKRN